MKKLLTIIFALSALMFFSQGQSTESKQKINRFEVRAAGSFDSVNTDEDLPSEFGNKVGTGFEKDNVYYQNYEKGYVTAKGSDGSYTYYYYGGYNIDASLVKTKIELAKLLEDVASEFSGTSDGADNVNNVLGSRFDKTALAQLFKDKYTEYYNNNFIMGLKHSKVKLWDGYICQDYTYGDGTFSAWGGNRYNMSFMMYNHKIKKIFLLTNNQALVWDQNKTLGYPISDAFKEKVKLPNSEIIEEVELQLFESGFVYKDNDDGSFRAQFGFAYDEEKKEFIAKASPSVPSEYGELKNTIKASDTKEIKVYEYGSIICELYDGYYHYTNRPARIYTTENDFTMIDINYFLKNVGDSIQGDIENKDHIKQLLKDKYKSLYESGFFVGFRESDFSGNWNGIYAQQFKLGDSTASPWEGSRTNIACLAYVQELDKVVLLKDNPLVLWNGNGNYNYWMSPIEDEFEKDGTIYQKFNSGLLVIIKNDLSLSFMYDGTFEEYEQGKSTYEKPYYGKEVVVTKETDKKGCKSAIGMATPFALLTLLGVVLKIRNRK